MKSAMAILAISTAMLAAPTPPVRRITDERSEEATPGWAPETTKTQTTSVAASSIVGREATSPVTSPSAAGVPDPALEILAFERDMEAAVVRGDAAFLDRICASDFSFTHGDGWTTGGQPLRVENKEQWLAAVGKAPYFSRDLDSVHVERHGDIAITYGRYRAQRSRRARTPGIYGLVRARLCAARRPLAVPVASHRAWADLRTSAIRCWRSATPPRVTLCMQAGPAGVRTCGTLSRGDHLVEMTTMPWAAHCWRVSPGSGWSCAAVAASFAVTPAHVLAPVRFARDTAPHRRWRPPAPTTEPARGSANGYDAKPIEHVRWGSTYYIADVGKARSSIAERMRSAITDPVRHR